MVPYIRHMLAGPISYVFFAHTAYEITKFIFKYLDKKYVVYNENYLNAFSPLFSQQIDAYLMELITGFPLSFRPVFVFIEYIIWIEVSANCFSLRH